jgi:hypothetical protein
MIAPEFVVPRRDGAVERRSRLGDLLPRDRRFTATPARWPTTPMRRAASG